MRKTIPFLLVLMAFVLGACSPAATSTPAAETPAEQTESGEPFATDAEIDPEAAVTVPGEAETNSFDLTAGCTVVSKSSQPTPESLFRLADETDQALGSPDARVTIIEYTDFQCPFCSQLAPVLHELKARYGEDLRVILRHFPLPSHDKAPLAAQAAEAAGLQDQFWGMHDLLFARQAEWSDMPLEEFPDYVMGLANELGLDIEQFTADLESDEVKERVQRDLDESMKLGLPGTPALLFNGQFYGGPNDLVNLSAIVDLIQLEDSQFTDCPPVVIDPSRRYRATIKTEKGDIVLELFADRTPIAVNNFVFLAQNDWYDGVTFHRVLPGFVAQAGDPTGTGFGGPGFAFKNEIVDGLNFTEAGLVGMANAGPDSNGSQFFITFGPQESLNGGYTIFARVISGMDVAEQLTPRNPATSPDAPPGDEILDVVIEES